MKKFFAMMMAGVMTMGMGVTAFAEDGSGDPTHHELEYTGKMQELTIEITLPTTPELIINPYKLEVTDPLDPDGETKVDRQFLTPDTYVFSTSNVALSANVTVTGTVGENSEATFVATAPKATSKAKEIFLFTKVSEAKKLEEKLAGYDEGVEAAEKFTFDDVAYDKTKDLLVSTEATTKNALFTLPAVTYDESDATETSYVAMRMCGAVNDKSETAWKETDTVNVAFVFDFVPTTPATE